MSLFDLLPLFPWEGPPLPRFLGIFWPGIQSTGQGLLSIQPKNYIKETQIIPYEAPLASYQNEESWSIEWSPEGMPTKITVHRQAQRNG